MRTSLTKAKILDGPLQYRRRVSIEDRISEEKINENALYFN